MTVESPVGILDQCLGVWEQMALGNHTESLAMDLCRTYGGILRFATWLLFT